MAENSTVAGTSFPLLTASMNAGESIYAPPAPPPATCTALSAPPQGYLPPSGVSAGHPTLTASSYVAPDGLPSNNTSQWSADMPSGIDPLNYNPHQPPRLTASVYQKNEGNHGGPQGGLLNVPGQLNSSLSDLPPMHSYPHHTKAVTPVHVPMNLIPNTDDAHPLLTMTASGLTEGDRDIHDSKSSTGTTDKDKQTTAGPKWVKGRQGLQEFVATPHVGLEDPPTAWNEQREACVKACMDDMKRIARGKKGMASLYEDKGFPAVDESIYGTEVEGPKDDLVWCRVGDIFNPAPDAAMSVSGSSAFFRGPLDDSFFHGALATLRATSVTAASDALVQYDPQMGIYGVVMYLDGVWVYDVLDDFVPFRKKEGQTVKKTHMAFGRTSKHDEYWVALLEKAYAKLHGSYATMVTSIERDVLTALTGVTSKEISMSTFDVWSEQYEYLRNHSRNSFALCAVLNKPNVPKGAEVNGLQNGSVYPVLRFATLENVKLVELQNPWNFSSWRGRWGLTSAEMTLERVKKLGVDPSRCSFWMACDDFCQTFSHCTAVRLLREPKWHSASCISTSREPAMVLVGVKSAAHAHFALSQPSALSGSTDEKVEICLQLFQTKLEADKPKDERYDPLEVILQVGPQQQQGLVADLKLLPGYIYLCRVSSDKPCDRLHLRVFVSQLFAFRLCGDDDKAVFESALKRAAPPFPLQLLLKTFFDPSGMQGSAVVVASPRPAAFRRHKTRVYGDAEGLWEALGRDDHPHPHTNNPPHNTPTTHGQHTPPPMFESDDEVYPTHMHPALSNIWSLLCCAAFGHKRPGGPLLRCETEDATEGLRRALNELEVVNLTNSGHQSNEGLTPSTHTSLMSSKNAIANAAAAAAAADAAAGVFRSGGGMTGMASTTVPPASGRLRQSHLFPTTLQMPIDASTRADGSTMPSSVNSTRAS